MPRSRLSAMPPSSDDAMLVPRLTVRAAASSLGVSPDSIRRWIRLGALPAMRVGPTSKSIRIEPEDLERLMSSADRPEPTIEREAE